MNRLYPRLWFWWFDLRRRAQGRRWAPKSPAELQAEGRMWRRAGWPAIADTIDDFGRAQHPLPAEPTCTCGHGPAGPMAHLVTCPLSDPHHPHHGLPA